jgi:chromate transport protein ChrA
MQWQLLLECVTLVVVALAFAALGSLNRPALQRYRAVLLVLLGVAGVVLCATLISQGGS